MMKPLHVVLHYTPKNRYSHNALLGALEASQVHDLTTVHVVVDRKELPRLVDDLALTDGKMVIVLSFFTVQLWEVHSLLQELKKRKNERLLIIARGPHPTGAPESVLLLGVDFVLRGEGEERLPLFLYAIATGGDCSAVPGISFLDGNSVARATPLGPWVDLDRYPPFSEKSGRLTMNP